MTRRQQVLRLGMMLALALLAATWLLVPPAPKPPAAVTPSAVVSPDSGTPVPTVSVTKLPPLPPSDARVQDVLPVLQSRADAGDGIAACRLSVELMRCQIIGRKFPDQRASLERLLAGYREKQNAFAISATQAKLEKLQEAEASCAHLPEGLADRAQHYLRAAALAGEPLSRLRYASGAGFNDTDEFDYLVTPAFDQWRREAETMMQQSLADGLPEATLILAFAYGGDEGLFSGLVADDDLRALAHVRLMSLVFGESLAAFPAPLPQSSMPEDDTSRAEAMANDWHARHFGGRQFDLRELMRTQGSSPWSERAAADTTTDPCPGREASDHG